MNTLEQRYKRTYQLLFLLVVMMTPLSGMGVDIIAPSTPSLTEFFGVSKQSVELIITVYIIGYGIGQVLTGVLSDRYGRKIVMITSSCMFIIFSLLVAMSQTVEAVILLRFLQGITVAGSAAVSRAIVTDSFTGEQRKKVANYLVIAWGIGPIAAPLIGAYFQTNFTWQYSLYFLALYAFLCISVAFLVPETNNKKSKNIKSATKNIYHIIKDKYFMTTVSCAGLCLANLYSFNIFTPYIFIEKLNIGMEKLSFAILIAGSGWLIGSVLNRALLKSISDKKLILHTSLYSIVINLIAISTVNLENNISLYIGSSLTTIVLSNLSFTRLFSICLGLHPDKAGVAGAMTGTFFILVGGCTALLASVSGINSLAHILTVYILTTLLIILITRSKAHSEEMVKGEVK
ncbi:MFS transporter [Pseudoalteromonas mariniglutinosa]|uniref:MFS transporter n=1 Tax=Pseudoalteromonas mariniglutinosa TaxID=206042 RepID=UPI0038516492